MINQQPVKCAVNMNTFDALERCKARLTEAERLLGILVPLAERTSEKLMGEHGGSGVFLLTQTAILGRAFLNSTPSETLREEITPPPGCLLGDGSTLSREKFADLYAAIETWYGDDATETS